MAFIPTADLIAKPVLNYVWDPGTMMWVPETQPGGSGGGGAVTIADGADVAEGSTTNIAVYGDNPGTVSAKLRGINAILFDVWDDTANSLRVDDIPERATAGAQVGVTVSTSAVTILASNASAKNRGITNNGSSNIYLGSSAAVTTSGAAMGLKLIPNGTYTDSGEDLYTGAIFGIGDAISASQNVSAWERT